MSCQNDGVKSVYFLVKITMLVFKVYFIQQANKLRKNKKSPSNDIKDMGIAMKVPHKIWTNSGFIYILTNAFTFYNYQVNQDNSFTSILCFNLYN